MEFSLENGHGQKCSLSSRGMVVASTVAAYKHRTNSACTEGFAAPLAEHFVSLSVIPVLHSRPGRTRCS